LRRTFGAAAAVLCIAAAIVPASAMAETAVFSGPMKWSGSLKIFLNGGSEKTCTIPSANSAGTSGSTFAFSQMKLSCTGSTALEWWPIGEAYFESGYHLRVNDFQEAHFYNSPYGLYVRRTFQVPWTNGSGSTQSTITFNKTEIGEANFGPITATGTVTATTTTGGLLTLSH